MKLHSWAGLLTRARPARLRPAHSKRSALTAGSPASAAAGQRRSSADVSSPAARSPVRRSSPTRSQCQAAS